MLPLTPPCLIHTIKTVSRVNAPSIPAPSLPPPPSKRTRKALKSEIEAAKTIVFAAIARGHSQEEAAKIAHVSAVSVGKWLKQARQAGTDLSRENMVNLLSQRIASPDTAPQYVTPMASLLADLQGWKSKRDEKIQLKSMKTLFDAWRNETDQSKALQDKGLSGSANLTECTLSDLEQSGLTAQSDTVQETKAPGEPPIENVNGSV